MAGFLLDTCVVSEGRAVHVGDGLIAAVALVNGLTIVTRNVTDFEPTSVPLFDPWT